MNEHTFICCVITSQKLNSYFKYMSSTDTYAFACITVHTGMVMTSSCT